MRELCCMGPIIPVDTKIQGIKTLFAIIAVVEKVHDLEGEGWKTLGLEGECNHQLELIATGYDAIEAAIAALVEEECARFEEDAEYSTLMEIYNDLKPLVKDVVRENMNYC